jgi:hypothetical protein
MEDNSEKLVSKKEAAAILEVSERTLQRLASKKQIMVVYEKKYHGGRIAYFPVKDVYRVKEAWGKKEKLPTVETPDSILKNQLAKPSKISTTQKTVSNKAIAKERKKVVKKSLKEVSVIEASVKLILTIQEVSVLTHIPEKELRQDLEKGKLRGLLKGHGWKVKRADLEDYVRSIYVPRRTDTIEDSGTNEIDLGDIGEVHWQD